jgi:transportin-3
MQIKYDFHQLPAETLVLLRNALLRLLPLHSARPKVITLQICISIASLALQMRTWNNVIPDVVGACGKNEKGQEALLQFLAVLPEEAYDGRRILLELSVLFPCGNA